MLRLLAATALCALLGVPHSLLAAATRTHVASSGNDANAAFSCDYAHPCRTFAVALANTTPGGEILAIDSSGYGKLVIDRSVSIIAAPGVFAGIGVGAGGNATGVDIATAGVKVVLRGLTITGQGGTYGIRMTDGASLSVENCVVANFSAASQIGLLVAAPAKVRILDTLIRDNYNGVRLQSGATASISGSELLGNTNTGIDLYGMAAATTTTAVVSDTVVAGRGSGWGILAETAAGVTARLEVIRSTVSGHANGVASWTSGGTSFVALGDSMVVGNTTGLYQSGAGASFHSFGNNLVTDNGADTNGGTITAMPRT